MLVWTNKYKHGHLFKEVGELPSAIPKGAGSKPTIEGRSPAYCNAPLRPERWSNVNLNHVAAEPCYRAAKLGNRCAFFVLLDPCSLPLLSRPGRTLTFKARLGGPVNLSISSGAVHC